MRGQTAASRTKNKHVHVGDNKKVQHAPDFASPAMGAQAEVWSKPLLYIIHDHTLVFLGIVSRKACLHSFIVHLLPRITRSCYILSAVIIGLLLNLSDFHSFILCSQSSQRLRTPEWSFSSVAVQGVTSICSDSFAILSSSRNLTCISFVHNIYYKTVIKMKQENVFNFFLDLKRTTPDFCNSQYAI